MEPVASCNLCYLHCRDLQTLLQPPLQRDVTERLWAG
jgi:hypothetical protein